MIRRLMKRFRGNGQPADAARANPYLRELSQSEVAQDAHRTFVGGMWEEMGRLQFDFLRSRGLQPAHRMLDIGCGALRGGIHFIRYLEPGHYYGMDMNQSLVRAGEAIELPKAGLVDRGPRLMVNGAFEFERFDTTFPFALALSVFTHMPINSIQRCLINVAQVLEPGGKLFATYFESPTLHHLKPIRHPDDIVTWPDADPFHYHFSVFQFLVNDLPLRVSNIGAWSHPRDQHMLEFTRT